MTATTILTFDCYGTLIDWESGILRAFEDLAPDGVRMDPSAVLAAYHTAEAHAESTWKPYRDVLAEVGERIVAELGWSGVDGRALALTLPAWKPFDDTVSGLSRLVAAGCRLGVLSNVDDALFDRTHGHWMPRIPFDVVVTAEQVRSYKPGHAHFEEGRRRIARICGDDARWVHLAQSVRHDLVPATALGIPCVHVDRVGQALQFALPEGVSVARVADLASLADAVDAGRWVWPAASR